MPRIQKQSHARHDPLHVQLQQDSDSVKYVRAGKRHKILAPDENTELEESQSILDAKTSQRIFELAKAQQDELEHEDGYSDEVEIPKQLGFRLAEDADSDDGLDEMASQDDDGVESNMFDIDSGDMETLEAMLPHDSGERKTLADIIFAKLDGGNVTTIEKTNSPYIPSEKQDPAAGLNPRVVEAYTKLGQFLKKYPSGALPKMFKVIPTLQAWARILALTHPEDWSPHACYAATRIFVPTMKPAQAQLFLQVVLLDSMRADIQKNQRLNPQYYEALKRALYKPAAFFKGIVFPLLDDGCTLKEATIVASVLARKTVPVLHASAALLRIAEMDYSGANSLFIRVLVDKKMQLPYKVVDALVFHFIRISNTYKARSRADSERLPVLWHQSLLAFCQRYASDLTPDQKDALLDVVRATPHAQIGPEVRRELLAASERGAPRSDVDGNIEMI